MAYKMSENSEKHPSSWQCHQMMSCLTAYKPQILSLLSEDKEKQQSLAN